MKNNVRTARVWLWSLAALHAGAALGAQPAPPASAMRFDRVPITGEECEKRATLALTVEGYSASSPAAGTYYGNKGIHSAYIVCKAAPNESTWATVFVASNSTDGNVPSRECLSLERRVLGTTANGPEGKSAAVSCSSSVLGVWNWIGNMKMTFNADGSVADSEGGRATWKALGGNNYQVHWLTYGQQTVNFTISSDGRSTTGGYQLTRSCGPENTAR
jgi:hypothetical protein